jgi:hypothetical protein
MQDYYGDPYISCRPECILATDCDRSKTCINTKCVDPCPGSCGLNADCRVVFHSPTCYCKPGFTGNPTQYCREIPASKFVVNRIQLIHVILHLVVHIASVMCLMVEQFAHVRMAFMVHHQVVVMNVQHIPIVQ